VAVDEVVHVDTAVVANFAIFLGFEPVGESAFQEFTGDNNIARCLLDHVGSLAVVSGGKI